MRAGWMVVALVALVGLAAHGQNTVALGDLRADDLLVTPAGAAAVAGQAAGLMLTNAVQAGYLCTVAAAHAIVAQAPTKAEMNAAVGGVAAQVAPLPGRISALEAGTNKWNAAHGWGDHSIRRYITAKALVPYATKVKLAGDLADKVTTQALNAVVAPLVSTQKLAQALSELTVEERDPAYWRAYHYGDPMIVPSPTNWFTFTAVEGGYGVQSYKYGDFPDMTDVVVPYEFDGQPVVKMRGNAFSGHDIISVIAPKSVRDVDPYAFGSCRVLLTANLPAVTNIEERAFTDCYALTNLVIGSVHKPIFGGLWNNELPGNCVITVTNPHATGWPADIDGVPVIRPAIYADNLGGGGGGEWQIVTNTAASVTITVDGGPVYWVGSGDPTLTLTGLVPGVPIYLVCQGMSSLQIAGSYLVGGGEFQAGRANHYLVWRYGAEVLVTGITTTAEGQP